ncbi:hypothetical protein DIPPA_14843 [Diplonema papillatum]|nr:hypothetical protein DIPPA_14843 [Diplonema papillatum]
MIDRDDAVWALLLLTNTAWAMALVYFLINSGKKTFVTEPPQPLNMNGRILPVKSGAAEAARSAPKVKKPADTPDVVELKSLQKEYETHKVTRDACYRELDDLPETHEAVMERLETQTATLRERFEKQCADVLQHKQRIKNVCAKSDAFGNQRQQQREAAEEEESQAQKLFEDAEEAKEAAEAARQQIDAAKAVRSETNKKLTTSQKQADKMEYEARNLYRKVQEINEENDFLRSEIERQESWKFRFDEQDARPLYDDSGKGGKRKGGDKKGGGKKGGGKKGSGDRKGGKGGKAKGGKARQDDAAADREEDELPVASDDRWKWEPRKTNGAADDWALKQDEKPGPTLKIEDMLRDAMQNPDARWMDDCDDW